MPDLDDEKYICFDCVREPFLTQLIGAQGKNVECSFCGETANSITVDELADRVETAFGHHYERTSDQPNSWQYAMMKDRESSYEFERDGMPILDAIQEAAGISEEAATDVLEILGDRYAVHGSDWMGEETEFDGASYYEERNANPAAWHRDWDRFVDAVKTENRFFSRAASELLTSVFADLDRLTTFQRRPLVVHAGPRGRIKHLYRARVFQSDEALTQALNSPQKELGPPPSRHASAGRMNARGISVFYGATGASVALAEVRPPVGSYVVVARFELMRKLRLLDLTALDLVRDEGSIFDPSTLGRIERAAFLRTLGQRMTRPVMPDDEALDYLPTQVAADFLASQLSPSFDGIVFRSAQSKDGRNVVLFHHAAKVAASEHPPGTLMDASLGMSGEDGWETEYSVRVIRPAKSSRAHGLLRPETPLKPVSVEGMEEGFDETRGATLRLDETSMQVHVVNSVKVNSTSRSVDHFYWDAEARDEPEF
ncbi:MAG: RES domain-containing protein [Roseateles sp.]|nr:MAG: RES domain-containing protein [Roseateles sp.]